MKLSFCSNQSENIPVYDIEVEIIAIKILTDTGFLGELQSNCANKVSEQKLTLTQLKGHIKITIELILYKEEEEEEEDEEEEVKTWDSYKLLPKLTQSSSILSINVRVKLIIKAY